MGSLVLAGVALQVPHAYLVPWPREDRLLSTWLWQERRIAQLGPT